MKHYRFIIWILLVLSSCGERNADKMRDSSQGENSTEERYRGNQSPESNKNRRTFNEPRTNVDPPASSKSSTTDKSSPKRSDQESESASVSQLFKQLQSGVFQVHTLLNKEPYSGGSGFFIAPGIGVTNYHVLEGSDAAFIEIEDEFFKIQSILATSPSEEMDFVIFKTNYQNNTILSISRDIPEIGNDVFAIGSPQGLSNSLTKGTVSGFRNNSRIQIDATIDHGSSGGPLFNMQGEVIGITTSGMGTGSELNFAVNIQALPYQRYVRN